LKQLQRLITLATITVIMAPPTEPKATSHDDNEGNDIYSQPTDEYDDEQISVPVENGEAKSASAPTTTPTSMSTPTAISTYNLAAKTTEEHPFKIDIGDDEKLSNISEEESTIGEIEATGETKGPAEAETITEIDHATLTTEEKAVDGCSVNLPIQTVNVLLNSPSSVAAVSTADLVHQAATAETDANKLKDETEMTTRGDKNLHESHETNIPVVPSAIDFGKQQHNQQQFQQHQKLDGRIQIGICAMDKKARSKPMDEILSRLDETLFRVVVFGDDLILNRPIHEWPSNIDVLIAFYSKGYPLQKAKDYVKLRRPVCLNDLDMQDRLQDRRMVYDLLEASGIDVPRHVFLSQDGYKSTGSGDGNKQGETMVKEFDDHIEVNGVNIQKPFVEKPVNADDHNIAIYYPTSAGGGCKKLFRKIGNRSSEFYPDISEIRRDGSYVYEEFVVTQGTDVKMYTVGPAYGHAEARKSPTVDGKVQRNADGKELRFPVILTLSEKEIARRIVLQFKQFVCGFDLLRVQEGHSVVSYCCDVNGFSFVKNSRKYYDDCAQILTEHMLAVMKPEQLTSFSTLDPLVTEVDDNINCSSMKSLQRVAMLLANKGGNSGSNNPDGTATNSHADTLSEDGLEETRSTGHMSTGMMSNEDPTLLEEGAVPVRQIPRELISEPASLPASRNVSCENLQTLDGSDYGEEYFDRSNSLGSAAAGGGGNSNNGLSSSRTSVNMHREELRCVIAVVRHADRTPKEKLKINTSEPIILKYFKDHSDKPNSTKDLKLKDKSPMRDFLAAVREIIARYAEKENLDKKGEKIKCKFMHMRDVLVRWKFSGLNRKLQLKPKMITTDETTGETTVKQIQLILKWGGDLTKLGENQAIQLGQQFRHSIYPDSPGGGILRLHSTFRHDLKIKTSDEGRVMKTAAAFAKGLLELEGEIPPILVSLVHKEKGSMHMLDPSGDKDVKLELDECKEKISMNLQEDIDWRDMTEEDRVRLVGPPNVTSMRDALARIGNPRKTLQNIYETMGTLIKELEDMLNGSKCGIDEKTAEEGNIPHGESEDADAQLSGVKLYKGETLLELTERWRFIYERLYDTETDTFDLTRIPDVLDNVRFDVLHNPNLCLTSTLHKLYSLAKAMADTVVPQEYGTTLAEKRSVGIKVCSSLLEKIRFDLHIARTDNKTDMRYMINMDYSADLPINTMGRRIRTRLYFTSESHLHTLINVLRFAFNGDSCSGDDCTSPVLSPYGMNLLNQSKEVCYLTQIVIRLFEDTGRRLNDPRRFRVEILYSAGATETPIHQARSTKETDLTRLDTEPLQAVGRDGLTCAEIEAFFDSIITERGKSDGHHDVEAISDPGAPKTPKNSTNGSTVKPSDTTDSSKGSKTPPTRIENSIGVCPAPLKSASAQAPEVQGTETDVEPNATRISPSFSRHSSRTIPTCNTSTKTAKTNDDTNYTRDTNRATTQATTDNVADEKKDNKNNRDSNADNSARFHKYFYLAIATGTLLLGAGCLVMAMGLTGSITNRRHYSRR